MFGCVLENTIKNTFSTCCSHFLTFSQLPNEYIISFIPKNTNKTQKRSHFLGEIAIARSVDCDRARSRSRLTPIGAITVIMIAIDADRSLSLALSVHGFFLYVALSLFCAFSGNRLKVKQQCKMIFESIM